MGRIANYEDGRIRRLAGSLAKAGVAQQLVERIMEGGTTIERSTPPERKAGWFGEAMDRMDGLLDTKTRHAVREACACCLGGKRLEMSRAIAKQHEALERRVSAANEAKLVFGHSVTMAEDGGILVRFSPEGQSEYRCVCLPKAKEPLSITYCYCCGGHVKHHLQIALGRKLACTVRSSALSSGGRQPCTFLFGFVG
jgi:hypothetical protein